MATNVTTKYANQIFNPATVAAAIDAEAFKGYRQYRIVQELPFDLSDTEAAKELEIWLDPGTVPLHLAPNLHPDGPSPAVGDHRISGAGDLVVALMIILGILALLIATQPILTAERASVGSRTPSRVKIRGDSRKG